MRVLNPCLLGDNIHAKRLTLKLFAYQWPGFPLLRGNSDLNRSSFRAVHKQQDTHNERGTLRAQVTKTHT